MKIKNILFILLAIFFVAGISKPFWPSSLPQKKTISIQPILATETVETPAVKTPEPIVEKEILLAKNIPAPKKEVAKIDVKPVSGDSWVQKEYDILKNKVQGIDEKVLKLALTAYHNARKNGYVDNQILTVIDYSKPSDQKRFSVIDMRNHHVLYNTHVSHGRNSGGLNSTSFSNSPGSYKTSLGVFKTDATYDGKNGYSLRLRGLDRGVNDNAYSRAIVVHGAAYANSQNVNKDRGLGRSLGCPTVASHLAKPIINAIKNGSIIFAYGNDKSLLKKSTYLS